MRATGWICLGSFLLVYAASVMIVYDLGPFRRPAVRRRLARVVAVVAAAISVAAAAVWLVTLAAGDRSRHVIRGPLGLAMAVERGHVAVLGLGMDQSASFWLLAATSAAIGWAAWRVGRK
jgi:hypothetical protein